MALHWIPHEYSVDVLCRGDPAALDLCKPGLYMLQQFIEGVDVGQLIALDLGDGGVDQPYCFPSSSPLG
ncbi:hypothetical protein STEG23_001751, partial [Scotinomys teguina]